MERTRDLMTPDPLAAREDTSIAECAAWMLKHRIRHIPVVDADDKPVGVLVDDVVFRFGGVSGDDMGLWIPFESEGADLKARDLAAPIAVAVDDGTPSLETLREVLRSPQDFAVVLDAKGALAGVVTEHDGVRLAARLLENRDLGVRAEASRPVHTTRRTEPALDALESMMQLGIRHLAVVGPDNVLVGIVSRGDLFSGRFVEGDTRTVGTVMPDKEPQTTREGTKLAEAAYRMLQEKIGCLPVVDDEGHPVRILTRFDLVEAAIDAMEEGD